MRNVLIGPWIVPLPGTRRELYVDTTAGIKWRPKLIEGPDGIGHCGLMWLLLIVAVHPRGYGEMTARMHEESAHDDEEGRP